uniref:Uncharacterized protein n=1 Tax=Siphoviridae sp. ct3r22 TaxID=2825325 RepID=A0A8S5V176_9CAUD|nr:MAG TPA: hypothetical protein [Siphoviridae sp. ct3r22]
MYKSLSLSSILYFYLQYHYLCRFENSETLLYNIILCNRISSYLSYIPNKEE